MQYESIRLSSEGDFAVLTLAQPKRRNPLAEDTIREILDALRRTGEGSARGIILAAEGSVFSAGHDFADMDGRDLAGMQRLLGVCGEMMQTIQEIPQPVIAQVEGLATAGGCQLVASCDLAVAGESTRFAVPGGRGGWFCTTPGVALARAVGRKRALEMLLTGDPIDAPTAEAWGLVNRVVSDDAVAEETRALLGRATRGSRRSKGVGKQAFHRQVDLDIRGAYDFATEVMASASQTEEAQEGIRAFLEKRKADFGDR
ncbi:MAG: enoyl-CoA hydratase/isomerase family protein [Deltaproteobacteria bacterium]|nr:enoyl-CoA hydratase/isomerase family protein [Deltaproteobacteria bacterium]MBW2448510.1 enoyl-CoA hydratase/isomerase family protein [Deltaproteobacteria bacterium]